MSSLLNWENRIALVCQRADKQWSDGNLREAFKLFLAAAKAGWVPAFGTVAQFYDNGWGVKTNFDAALHWYTRAYNENASWYRLAHRHGDSTSANNIGCILRDRGKHKRAIEWFQRAVKLGDGDANFNIAEIYLRNLRDRPKAIHYLQKTIKAPYVTDGSIEEAKALLKKLRTKTLQRSKTVGQRSR
jgi:TPR repeat protein